MYIKILIFILLFVCFNAWFVFLYTQNPDEVSFHLTTDTVFNLPLTVLVFMWFFMGVAITSVFTFLVEMSRTVRDMRYKREKKLLLGAEKNYIEGLNELKKGKSEKARNVFQKIIAIRPRDVEAVIRLSESYVQTNSYTEAIETLEEGLSKNPGNLALLFKITTVAKDSGDIVKEESALMEILDHNSENIHALTRLREISMKKENWEEAVKRQIQIVSVTKKKGGNGDEKSLLAALLYEKAKDLHIKDDSDNALLALKESYKTDSAFIPSYVMMADIYREKGNTDEAKKLLSNAYDKAKANIALIKLEDIYMEEGKPEEVISLFKGKLEKDATDENLQILLSRLYLRLEMIDEAINELEEMEAKGVENRCQKVLLAEAYARRTSDTKATDLYREAFGLSKSLDPPFKCVNCGKKQESWTDYCTNCFTWNNYKMKCE